MSDSQKYEVDKCYNCPFMGSAGLTYCELMPWERDISGYPKYSVPNMWNSPMPQWCPLKTKDILVTLGNKLELKSGKVYYYMCLVCNGSGEIRGIRCDGCGGLGRLRK